MIASALLYASLGASGLMAGYALVHTRRLLMMARMKLQVSSLPLDDLPSVSVCIPARNETHVMTQCLERVLASSYPKMEVIVLDDSSVDDTSILIKSFAHSGVRFVEGAPLPEGWLGKNHALRELLREASGSYVVFMDVDTHISPFTIEQLVAYARNEKAAMVSVLPRRSQLFRMSSLGATLRYFWTLLFHSKAAPAVSSSLWLVERAALSENERRGFADEMAEVVRPEFTLAKRFSKEHRYRFLVGSNDIAVSYEKKWSSQIETAIRLLYPMVGGHFLQALAATLILAAVLLPFVILIVVGVMRPSHGVVLGSIAGGVCLLWFAVYGRYLATTWPRWWYLGVLFFPYSVLQECILLWVSVYRYATHTITWKGRPIRIRARRAE